MLKVSVGSVSTESQAQTIDACGTPSGTERRHPEGNARKITAKTSLPTRMTADPESNSAASPYGSCELKSISLGRFIEKKLQPAAASMPKARTLTDQRRASGGEGGGKAAAKRSPMSPRSPPITILGRERPTSSLIVLGVSADALPQ